MAQMIPPDIYTGCPSPGEREMFARLKLDPGTKDWTVLHSLDIAEHRTQVAGEIDFVVIVPAMGVLCIEVKAHHSIRCENGLWYYGSDARPERRGPFRQASDAMHSIRNRLVQGRPDLRGVVFWSAVVFPYVEFRQQSPEWHSWQVIDATMFMSRPISQVLLNVLDQAHHLLRARTDVTWYSRGRREPSGEQCCTITQALRPDFEFYEPSRLRAARLQDEVKHYTEEQFVALEAMQENPRVVFVGPAGTGKTTLAVECARRAQGVDHRTLMICYNRLLGQWLENEMRDLHPRVTARTLHSHMLAVSGAVPPGTRTPTPSFWEDELPAYAVNKLLSEDANQHLFDELVIDEAPDILRPSYLDFLDLSLKGGLAAGRWRMFGDFEKQSIYGSANLTLNEFLAHRSGLVPIYSLRTNCRNTPRIVELVQLLGGLAPGYSRVLRPDNGVEPDIVTYADAAQQTTLLVEALEKLYIDGFRGPDITVLSPQPARSSRAAAVENSPWKERLQPYDQGRRGCVGYASIRAFKGLESPAVIVTDIDQIIGAEATALFYIAITRTLHRLVILVDNKVRGDMLDILIHGQSA
jgi:hypothetical protein